MCYLIAPEPFITIFVIVVLDFNASLNDVAPVSPMLFPVDCMRMGRVDC